jgi:predicted transcriptional regulator
MYNSLRSFAGYVVQPERGGRKNMATLSIQLDDRLAELLRELAAAQVRSESEVVSEALTAYAETRRPAPQGMGKYHSGRHDTSANARSILREAVREGRWP